MKSRKKPICIFVVGLTFCIKLCPSLLPFQQNGSKYLKVKTMLVLTTNPSWPCVKSAIKLLRQLEHHVKVWIINNHFEKYKEKLLKLWHPEAEILTNLLRNPTDVILRNALENFVNTDNEWLIYLSTETLVTKNWWNKFEKAAFEHPNSILFLCQSPERDSNSDACDEYCLQRQFANSGIALSMRVAVLLLFEMRKHKNHPNWDWVNWCRKQEIPILKLGTPLLTCIVNVNYSIDAKKFQVTKDKISLEGVLDLRNCLNKTLYKKISKKKELFFESKTLKKMAPVYAKCSTSSYHEVPCDVPCFWTSSSDLIRTVTSDKYTFKLSMEGSHYYPVLSDRSSLLGTTSFDSEIPLPYYNWSWTRFLDKPPNVKDIWSHNNIQTPPKGEIPRILFMARNCHSLNNREKIVKELFDMIDSVSACMNNSILHYVENKDEFMENYMFYAAFENGRVKDYVTEKLWGAFASGTLPIVYGPPNIWEHVPPKSILNVEDFSSIAALRKHVEYLIENRTAYDEYHAWRKQPLPRWFVKKYNFTHVHSACRLCRWVAAKRDGLKWDREQQEII